MATPVGGSPLLSTAMADPATMSVSGRPSLDGVAVLPTITGTLDLHYVNSTGRLLSELYLRL